MTELSIVVAGGGTAGHIEPALAVADALRDGHGAQVVALGTTKGLEKDLIPERGYELALINPVPVPRKPNADLALLPFRVIKAVMNTRKILKRVHADAVIGFGGYVSAPAYLAARSLGIPFFVHEANARAGMANKLGVFLGGIGLNAVSNSGMKGDVVGVPIRASLAPDAPQEKRKAEACDLWGLDPNKPRAVPKVPCPLTTPWPSPSPNSPRPASKSCTLLARKTSRRKSSTATWLCPTSIAWTWPTPWLMWWCAAPGP